MARPHSDVLVSDFRLKGIPAFRGGDREYETSAAAANLVFAYTRPGCVIQPETTEQVQYVVEQAKDAGENIIVKGGGHSYTGFSTTDRGVLLDMKRMNGVKLQLDKDKKPASVKIQGGARWVDVYRTLINGGWDGYVVVGGRCPAVGVGGFILGGGLGPFTREFGLGSDSLIEATIVTANGRRITVGEESPKGSPERELFWALRGAGSNAFGVVTEFRMKVQKLKDEKVVAGRYEWPIGDDKDWASLKATMQKFYTAKWPKEMTIDSNWMLDVNSTSQVKRATKIRFSFYFNGNQKQFEEVVTQHIDDTKLRRELIKRSRPEQSTRFLHESLLLIWNEESRMFIPNQDDNAYQKYSSFCFKNDEADISNILEAVQQLQKMFAQRLGEDKASFWTTFIHAGGQATESTEESAYPWRATVYNTYVTIKFTDKWVETIANDFLLEAKKTLKQFSLNGDAAYINFSDSAIYEKWGEAYYGQNFEKLIKIRQIWNKDNYFDWPWQEQERMFTDWLKLKRALEGLKNEEKIKITGWDITGLPAWSSWRDKDTPAPIPPPPYEATA